MPIEPLTSGNDYVEDFKSKINEIVLWINKAEQADIVPSNAGKIKLPDAIDLRGFVTKEEARQAGLQV